MQDLTKIYEKHVVKKLFRMHKFSEVHTTDKINLLKGTKINSKVQKAIFEKAIKNLENKKLIFCKKKDYAKNKKVYYLNLEKEEEIKKILNI